MFKDDIFETWLDKKANEIMEELGNGKALSSEEMMVLVLKAQTNHFSHLDVELREDMKNLREDLTSDMKNLREDLTSDMKILREDMNRDMTTLREDMNRDMTTLREDMDKRFEQVDKRFEQVISRMDRFMIWSLGLTFSSTIFLLGAMYKFMG